MEIQPYSYKSIVKAVRAIVNTEGVTDYHEIASRLNERGVRTRFNTEFNYNAAGGLFRKHCKAKRKRVESVSAPEVTTTKSTDNGAIASLILESNLTKGQKLKALEAIL